ncbi:MAG: type IV toxin-antitoxin system AbiEi family antitoxin [Bacteroidota bacterium]
MLKSTYKYIEAYLDHLQAKGRYAVTLIELVNRFDVSEKAIKQNIFRLKRKNRLAHVRKGFYVIVPPQYSNRGMVPPTLFIDDLMKDLNRNYYIGALSASALQGAGHQQPMEFQVMVNKPPLRSIKGKRLSIRFFVKSKWLSEDIFEKKTETGYIKISSPSLTAFDLVYYSKKIGGLNRIIPMLEELAESIKPADLKRTAAYQKTPNIQRLGYLFERLGNEKLASTLLRVIEKKPMVEIPISLAHKGREGKIDSDWNVIINTKLDF